MAANRRLPFTLVYSGKYDYSPENNVTMDAMKEALEIRLLQRLREDESGVYSPGVQENTSLQPQQRYKLQGSNSAAHRRM